MMPFSRTEQILSRVLDCLLNATPAGDRVERGRQAAYAAGDAPAGTPAGGGGSEAGQNQ